MGIKSLSEKLQRPETIKGLGVFFIVYAAYQLFKDIRLYYVDSDTFNVLGWVTYFDFVNSIFLIIIATQVLQLKEWSRKAIIFYSFYMILSMNAFYFPYTFSKLAAVVIRDRQSNLKYFFIFGCIYFTLNQLIAIYFFTRPKVKEQFK